MGDSVTIVDTVWTGRTGRELRKHPAEVREMQFYLLGCPEKNRYGLYVCELDTAIVRTGRSAKRIDESLRVLTDLGFCKFDQDAQWVWVIEMAQHQFGLPLKAVDYRCGAARKWYSSLPRNRWMGEWFDRYAEDFDFADRAKSGANAVERREWIPRQRDEPTALDMPHREGLLQPRSKNGSDLFSEGEGVIGGSGGKEGEGERLTGKAFEMAFEALWPIYPNGKEKANAKTELAKLKPTRAFMDKLRESIIAHGRSEEWLKEGGRYIPRLVNFIKKRGWEDRIDGPRPVLTSTNQANLQAAQGFVNRRRGEPQ